MRLFENHPVKDQTSPAVDNSNSIIATATNTTTSGKRHQGTFECVKSIT